MRRSVPIEADHEALGGMGLGHRQTATEVHEPACVLDLQLHGPLKGALSGLVAPVVAPGHPLGRDGHLAVHRPMRQEHRHLLVAHLRRMAQAAEADEGTAPVDVYVRCSPAAMRQPTHSHSRSGRLTGRNTGSGVTADDTRMREGENGYTDDDMRRPVAISAAAAGLVTTALDDDKFNVG